MIANQENESVINAEGEVATNREDAKETIFDYPLEAWNGFSQKQRKAAMTIFGLAFGEKALVEEGKKIAEQKF